MHFNPVWTCIGTLNSHLPMQVLIRWKLHSHLPILKLIRRIWPWPSKGKVRWNSKYTEKNHTWIGIAFRPYGGSHRSHKAPPPAPAAKTHRSPTPLRLAIPVESSWCLKKKNKKHKQTQCLPEYHRNHIQTAQPVPEQLVHRVNSHCPSDQSPVSEQTQQ